MRINKRFIKISILPLICVLTLAIFLFGSEFLARKTVDDGQNIRQILEQNPRGQVLGDLESQIEQNTGQSANFTNKKQSSNLDLQNREFQNPNSNIPKSEQNSEKVQANKCPKNLPIIGWIDYSGKKLIKKELPIGQKPTICFETIENAKLEGYFEK